MVPGILPDLSASEALEATRIYGVAGEPPWPRPLLRRPFRAPHASITAAGLLGGGNPPTPGESSAAVRSRVDACRAVQETRYAGRAHRTNGTVRSGTAGLLRELTPEAAAFLTRAAERLALSGRAIGKACRVARTIADLAGERRAGHPHVAEALQYRLSGFGAPGETT